MDDTNDNKADGPQTPPSRTEQLRIVGAEEAGSLAGRTGHRSAEPAATQAPNAGIAGQGDDEARAGAPRHHAHDADDDVRHDDDTDDGLDALRQPRPRSVFDSIPDAPPSFLDDLFDDDMTDAGPVGGGGDAGGVRRLGDAADVSDTGGAGRSGAHEAATGDDDTTRAIPRHGSAFLGQSDDDTAWDDSRHAADDPPGDAAGEPAEVTDEHGRRRGAAAGPGDADQASDSDPNRFGAVPIIRVGQPDTEASEEIELPHWTEPPTGQVPKVLVDEARGDDDTWSTYGAAPRWRDPSTEWEESDYSDVAALGGGLPREGALDEGERPSLDEFFSFDDLEATAQARRTGQQPATAPAGTGERPRRADQRPGPPLGPEPSGPSAPRNVPVAVAAGVGLGVLAIILLRIGPAAMMALVTVAVGIGAAELLATARRVGFHPATLVGLAASAGLPLAVYWRGEAAYPLVLFLAVAFTLFWYVFGIDIERPIQNVGVTLLSYGYVGLFGSFAALMLRQGKPLGTNLLLAAIIPTVAADVGAFVVGRNAGRSPLSPISPGKTVEGALGGFAAAVTASVVLNHFLLDLKPFDGLWDSAMLGVVIGIVSLLGDLSESLLKRSLGVKDMGTLIPEHGGVLDRFDALLFVLPATYYLARLLDLLPR